jgi:hypothetical protein
MPLPGQRPAHVSSNVIYKTPDDIDIVGIKLSASNVIKDNKTMEEEQSKGKQSECGVTIGFYSLS